MLAAYEIALKSGSDVWHFVLIAAVCGFIGALAAELILSRGKARETGVFELPKRRGRYLDVGSLATMVLGPVAAVIASYFFSPVRDVVENNVTTTKYDVIRLIGISLAAGLASSGFLASMQEKFTASLTNERMKTALEQAATAMQEMQNTVRDPGAQPTERAAKDAHAALASRVEAQSQLALEQLQRTLAGES
jgi:hypothetical protein